MLAVRLIEVPAWGPASLIEIIWLAIGLAVVAFAGGGMPEALRYRRAAIRTADPVMRLAAGGYLRREVIRMIQGAAIVAIGGYACWVGQPVPGPVVITPVGLVLTGALLLIGALNAVQSGLDRRQWRLISAHLR